MNFENLTFKAHEYLQNVCVEIPNRRTGSSGNRAAVAFFAELMSSFGFETHTDEFSCIDWSQGGASLTINGLPFDVQVSPYSNGGRIRAPLLALSTEEELEDSDLNGKIILLRAELTKEQLMPKNFPFYNPEHHQRLYQLLESKQPLAVIAATTQDPNMTGAVYPFPLIEDGDFEIPSVYMTEQEGDRLAMQIGGIANLDIRAQRFPAIAGNVIAHKGAQDHRVVVCAHIDAKDGTPGALDNASGITILLLLGELLKSYSGELGIEIVAINGEDYYNAPGEQLYLSRNQGFFDQIELAINLDGVGYKSARVAYSFYELPDPLASAARTTFAVYPNFIEGQPWYQGDHMIFTLNQRPAIAITSESLIEILTQIAHTPKDTPDLINPASLAHTASGLKDFFLSLVKKI